MLYSILLEALWELWMYVWDSGRINQDNKKIPDEKYFFILEKIDFLEDEKVFFIRVFFIVLIYSSTIPNLYLELP